MYKKKKKRIGLNGLTGATCLGLALCSSVGHKLGLWCPSHLVTAARRKGDVTLSGKSLCCSLFLTVGCSTSGPFCSLSNCCSSLSSQLFPLNPDPRWQSSNLRPISLALQQALGQELARIRQGNVQTAGIAARLLQAVAALMNSSHSGTLVMAMHHNHFISCPLMRQLYQYQVGCGPRLLSSMQWFGGGRGAL